MNRQTTVTIALGSYFSCALGLWMYFHGKGETLAYSLWMSLYWSYLTSCLGFLLISVCNRRAMFPKLTTYFQIWGTLGTFMGLIQMCDSIKAAVNAGDTEAIKGVLAGFSTALITSLVGMLFALFNDMLPEEEETEAPRQGEAGPTTQSQDAPQSPSNVPVMPATVPQTVVYQAVMPPISTATAVPAQANAQEKGGSDHGTP